MLIVGLWWLNYGTNAVALIEITVPEDQGQGILELLRDEPD